MCFKYVHKKFILKKYDKYLNRKKEGLGRTKHLLSFDKTRTA
jgi:hypothetical protein